MELKSVTKNARIEKEASPPCMKGNVWNPESWKFLLVESGIY